MVHKPMNELPPRLDRYECKTDRQWYIEKTGMLQLYDRRFLAQHGRYRDDWSDIKKKNNARRTARENGWQKEILAAAEEDKKRGVEAIDNLANHSKQFYGDMAKEKGLPFSLMYPQGIESKLKSQLTPNDPPKPDTIGLPNEKPNE